ncbi:MAG TPA: hypothetical protein VF077_01065 [Nitrospiraceae bacterium]
MEIVWKSAEYKHYGNIGLRQHAFEVRMGMLSPICGASLAHHTIRNNPKTDEKCDRCALKVARAIIEQ